MTALAKNRVNENDALSTMHYYVQEIVEWIQMYHSHLLQENQLCDRGKKPGSHIVQQFEVVSYRIHVSLASPYYKELLMTRVSLTSSPLISQIIHP